MRTIRTTSSIQFYCRLANSGSKMDINTIAAALGDDPITAMKYYTRLFPETIIERQIKLVMDSK